MANKNDEEVTINELSRQIAIGFTEIKKDNEDFAISVAKGFNEVNEKFDKRFDQMDKKIEDEIRSVKAEISLGFREVKEEISLLNTRIEKNRKSAVKDIDELVVKAAACESDRSKIKQEIAKLKLAS